MNIPSWATCLCSSFCQEQIDQEQINLMSAGKAIDPETGSRVKPIAEMALALARPSASPASNRSIKVTPNFIAPGSRGPSPTDDRDKTSSCGIGQTSLKNSSQPNQSNGAKQVNIHFIWIGGKIPVEYLRNIKECAAKALSDMNRGHQFTVNLWLNDPRNYWHTALTEDNCIHSKRFKLRDISELNEGIANSYSDDEAKKIGSLVRRELAGFKNFAAAADILRYIILQQEGGFYFDTDLTFSAKIVSSWGQRLQSKTPRADFWEKEKMWEAGRHETTLFKLEKAPYGLKMSFAYNAGNNCVIFAEKESSYLGDVVTTIISNYDRLEKGNKNKNCGTLYRNFKKSEEDEEDYGTLYRNFKKSEEDDDDEDDVNMVRYNKLPNHSYKRKTGELSVMLNKNAVDPFKWMITGMDVKRYGGKVSLGYFGNRRNLTIGTTLQPLCDKLRTLGSGCQLEESFSSGYTCDETVSIRRDQPIRIKCDNTWLKNLDRSPVDDNHPLINPFIRWQLR